MKKTIILLILIAVAVSAISQESSKFSFELGKLSSYELTMTEYETDTTADAIVIYESGNFYFSPIQRGYLVKSYKTKIKILKPSGIERAKFAIPVFNESEYVWEKFYIQTANVYNYNSITKQLEKSTFEDEEWLFGGKKTKETKLNSNYIIKKFTLPNVKVGSIIELEYIIETPFVFAFSWQFQKNIPVVYSNFCYRTAPYSTYGYYLNSDKKFDYYNEEIIKNYSDARKEKILTFVIKNIPAFKPDNKNGMLTLEFQYNEPNPHTATLRDWNEFNTEILAYYDFGKYIKKSEKAAKKILPTLNLSGKNQLETMETVLSYVKSNYNWNGIYGKYVLHQLPDFIKHKNGNAANINLFLIGLLKQAKISVNPVLISQYAPNNVGELYPFDALFKYVIAAVTIGNKTYYIDAADFEKKSDIMGFLVNKKMNLFIKIDKIEPSTINNLKTIPEKYDSDGELTTLLNRIKNIW